ncbi:MAG: glycoside hydrolase family 66 protein [Spirochaetota bacterium]
MNSYRFGCNLLFALSPVLIAGCISDSAASRKPSSAIIIEDAYPDKAAYHPGENAAINLVIRNISAIYFRGSLVVKLIHLASEIDRSVHPIEISAGAVFEAQVDLHLPQEDFRGYGVEIEIDNPSGDKIAYASTALDVLSDWSLAPRYGFLADFSPGEPNSIEKVKQLSKYHINVVQFYDWMYRHYQLLPPKDRVEFTDGMGRRLSIETVKHKIDLCHVQNMAALAYGAVYGAEPEFFNAHPELALYKPDGTPESIEKLFYIMDIRRVSPWHDLIIGEYIRAVTELPFDGIHMDQYGFPKRAFAGGKEGELVELDNLFGPLIDDSARAIRDKKPSAKVIFNSVNNWPTEKVADSDQAAVYIEVWPPHNSFSDLKRLIINAKEACRRKKQVILAAYMSPLFSAKKESLEQAETAARLTTAAIFASGGFHLLLGEKDGALCDAYYPKYATLRPEFARIMRDYYDFFVRYENWLVDKNLIDVSEKELSNEGLVQLGLDNFGYKGRSGEVWTIIHAFKDFLTINLVNFTGLLNDYWNLPHKKPQAVKRIPVEIKRKIGKVYLASPDYNRGTALELETNYSSGVTRFIIPELSCWSLVIIRNWNG